MFYVTKRGKMKLKEYCTYSTSVGLPFSLSLSVLLPFPFLSSTELSFSPGLFHSFLSFLGQLGGWQWSKEKVCPGTRVVATIQVLDKPEIFNRYAFMSTEYQLHMHKTALRIIQKV